MTNCKAKECAFENWNSSEWCVLHYCGDIGDQDKDRYFGQFKSEFKQYIINKSLLVGKRPDHQQWVVPFANLMLNHHHNNIDGVHQKFDCKIEEINFQFLLETHLKIIAEDLNKLKSFYFLKCTFNNLDLFKSVLRPHNFEECTFLNELELKEQKFNKNVYLFNKCDFKGNVTCYGKAITIDYGLFENCEFNWKGVSLYCVTLQKPLFKFNPTKPINIEKLYLADGKIESELFFIKEQENIKINKISIHRCEMKSKLNLRYIKNLKELDFNQLVFNDSVNIKECEIDHLKITSVDFKKSVNFTKSIISDISVEESKFQRVTFDDIIFGKKQGEDKSENALFKMVSFEGFVSFYGAHFKKGLNIDNTFFKEGVNFLTSVISYDGTTRETYRRIKDSFDKAGNHIEGNKYYALEMKKYKDELKEKPFYNQSKLIFILNYYISGYGQNYFRPLFFMIILTTCYCLADKACDLIVKYFGDQCIFLIPNFIYPINSWLNSFAKNVLPFKGILTEGKEYAGLIYHICFAVLLMHLLIAIKRLSRR